MLIFELIAEQRIREAIENGEMENLPGAGAPIEIDETPFVSPEQRMINHILKRAGLVPSDVSMRRAIAALREEIKHLPSGGEQMESKRRELTYLLIRFDEERRQA